MNAIPKIVRATALLALLSLLTAAACLYFDVVPARLRTAPSTQNATLGYTCPMHAEIKQQEPGSCSICGMALVPVETASKSSASHSACGDHGENHPNCCSPEQPAPTPTNLKLPPGHPPVPGWTVDTVLPGKTVSSNSPAPALLKP